MITPPTFGSLHDYGRRLADVSFWSPYVREVLTRHDLFGGDDEIQAGFVGTYPTFLYRDVVVKLFGYFETWRANHRTERTAQALVAEDPIMRAPSLLGAGHLYDDAHAPWPYLISNRVPGTAWRDATFSGEQQHAVVAELGRQVARLHALHPTSTLDANDWPHEHRASAAERHKAWGTLPSHLIDQIDSWVDLHMPWDRTLIHADLTADHIFVSDGQLTGIIDWGDAMRTERHYELVALHLDLLDGDVALLRTFLEAADWPADDDFARRALTMTLLHQFNVLKGVAVGLHLQDVDTLDDLATRVYGL